MKNTLPFQTKFLSILSYQKYLLNYYSISSLINKQAKKKPPGKSGGLIIF